ncbi:HTH_Tnp_Tc3_2 domain-containing protein [Trichonephila clavipes]|nr:HTH_Tnp_Tc3_2 domain-containing protein [Trichonephila clavipes]
MKTRLRTPSTDKSSRRPPHRKNYTRKDKCFNGHHPGTGSTFTMGPCVFLTIRRRLIEGHLGSRRPLRVLLSTPPPINASVFSGATHEETGLQRNGTQSSLATNPDSISALITIVFVCENPVVNASILPLLYSDTTLPQLV